MLSRISRTEISLRTEFVFFSVCFLFLTLRGPHSLADSSIYFSGGQKLVAGIDPYDGGSPIFSAPLGSRFFYVVGKSLNIVHFPIIWQIVNIVGVSFFFFIFLRELKFKFYTTSISGLLLLSAPVREMVINNQVTGFVLGIAAICIYFSKVFANKFLKISLLIPIYLACELKPNLIFGFLVYFLWTNRSWYKEFLSVFLFGFLLLYQFGILNEYGDWISHISTQGYRNLTGFESLGLSSLLFEADIFNFETARIAGISLFALSLVLLAVVLFKREEKVILVVIPLIGLAFPYLHYLDLIVALPFVISILFQDRHLAMLIPMFLSLLYLPRPSESFTKNALIICVIIVVSYMQYTVNKDIILFSISLFLGVYLVLTNYLVMSFALSDHVIQNFTVLRSLLLVFIIVISAVIKSFGSHVSQGAHAFGLN